MNIVTKLMLIIKWEIGIFERSVTMNHVKQDRFKSIYRRVGFPLIIIVSVVIHMMCANCVAEDEGGVEHYKMISTLEYEGDGQFRSQTESGYSVTKEIFANDRVRYSFVMSDPNDDDEELWRYSIAMVRAQFSEHVWAAFWRTTVDAQPAAEVAEELAMSVAAVYQAKSRVLRRLRRDLRELEHAE